MGFFRDIFEEKKQVWEGTDTALYQQYCKILKNSGIKIQAFKVNKERPKCNGNCASCAAMQEIPEGKETWEKIGSGLCDDLIGQTEGADVFTIYVKKSDVEKAKVLLYTNTVPDGKTIFHESSGVKDTSS